MPDALSEYSSAHAAFKELSQLQYQVMEIAHEAGKAIMEIYLNGDGQVHYKADASPLTLADTIAHDLIRMRLSQLAPDTPVLSEESAANDVSGRHHWRRFWLVDPLDGTKEFIRRNGEFTVNIALINEDKPVLSVIVAPALNQGFSARQGESAVAYQVQGAEFQPENLHKIHVDTRDQHKLLTFLESRSHGRRHSPDWFRNLPPHVVRARGSSLKLCEIAMGAADAYLRIGPTSEWDTAAGQLILECAGGALRAYTPEGLGNSFSYNQRDTLLNTDFIAYALPIENLLIPAMNSSR